MNEHKSVVPDTGLPSEDQILMYEGIREELKEIKQLLQLIEKNTQNNGSIIVPKEVIGLLIGEGKAPMTSIFGGN